MSVPPSVFAANNHSKWQITYRSVDDVCAQHLTHILQVHYSYYVGSIVSIEQVDEAEVNSNNFKITIEKEGTQRLYLLRRVPASRSRELIERSCEIMSAVASCGVHTPRVLLADNGEMIIEASDGWFILFDFIPGDHYRGTWEELVDSGAQIAVLDKELLVLTPTYADSADLPLSESYKKVREFSAPIWEAIFAKAEALSSTEGEGSFGVELLVRREEIVTAVCELEAAPVTTFQLVHFDLHPHNLLANGAQLLAILDFDSVRYLEKMRAVAFALHRLVRQHIVHTTPIDQKATVQKAMAAFIGAYRSHHTLSDEEVQTIPYFIKHESLSRLTGAMKEYANTGQLIWKEDLVKQLSNIREANFFV